jgi:hypothetical protein
MQRMKNVVPVHVRISHNSSVMRSFHKKIMKYQIHVQHIYLI